MPVTESTPTADEHGRVKKEVAFARVLTLGLFDYMRKSMSKGCVVSLSGGVDSASTAVLVWLMLVLSHAELGAKGAVSRLLGDAPAFENLTKLSSSELCERLLLTVYQTTDNSSEVTKEAARAVAEAISAEHHEIDVESLTQQYRALTEGVLGRPLSWQRDDVALQNIQARVRAPSVWMLANVRGSLLLSTSNRSEAAVGYATMDGDTAGGLCLLGGIDKSYLRKWLLFMEEEGLPESGALPGLRAVNEQAPTAELRPPERKQTDEQDLMPYDVLDAIERLAICERLSPREVSHRLTEVFVVWTRAELLTWVVRFYRLFAQNQWKRERYAPSFHVDDANLDPKTWCRFPILSGGFAREISELESEVDVRRS
jgi:NAD+ synthase (glutamine-hydrolysing)